MKEIWLNVEASLSPLVIAAEISTVNMFGHLKTQSLSTAPYSLMILPFFGNKVVLFFCDRASFFLEKSLLTFPVYSSIPTIMHT